MSQKNPNVDLAYLDYLDGMSYKEIAEKYNISATSTVSRWASKYEWNKEKAEHIQILNNQDYKNDYDNFLLINKNIEKILNEISLINKEYIDKIFILENDKHEYFAINENLENKNIRLNEEVQKYICECSRQKNEIVGLNNENFELKNQIIELGKLLVSQNKKEQNKAKVGRKTKITDAMIQKVIELSNLGSTQADIAVALQISIGVVNKIIQQSKRTDNKNI